VTGQQPAYQAPTGPTAAYRPPTGQVAAAHWPPAGPTAAYRPPVTGQQPSYQPPTGPSPAFRPPADQGPRPSGYVQPTYPAPAQHHPVRSGRHPVVPTSQGQGTPLGQPSASPFDWTGQLGGWSTGVAQVRLDTTGGGETSLWGDRADDRLSGLARERSEAAFPQQTDHLWPSVTTDPFGTNAQATVRAERRERSRTASFGFQLHMHTPRRARRHTVEFAEYWGLDHVVEAAELVVSELMTNALEASLPGLDRQGVSMAVAPLELRLSAEGRHLRIEIRDHNPDPPVLEEPDVEEERGRGLILVDSYCEVWGYHRLPTGGKVVWCLIGPPADA
jgi:hypothetical protein